MSVIELLMIFPFIAEGMCCHRVTLNGLLIGITVRYSVLRESEGDRKLLNERCWVASVAQASAAVIWAPEREQAPRTPWQNLPLIQSNIL